MLARNLHAGTRVKLDGNGTWVKICELHLDGKEGVVKVGIRTKQGFVTTTFRKNDEVEARR